MKFPTASRYEGYNPDDKDYKRLRLAFMTACCNAGRRDMGLDPVAAVEMDGDKKGRTQRPLRQMKK